MFAIPAPEWDKPAENVEVIDGEKLVHRVAANKEGEEIMSQFFVLFHHLDFLPEQSHDENLWILLYIVEITFGLFPDVLLHAPCP